MIVPGNYGSDHLIDILRMTLQKLRRKHLDQENIHNGTSSVQGDLWVRREF